jgi:hypothetical protein
LWLTVTSRTKETAKFGGNRRGPDIDHDYSYSLGRKWRQPWRWFMEAVPEVVSRLWRRRRFLAVWRRRRKLVIA